MLFNCAIVFWFYSFVIPSDGGETSSFGLIKQYDDTPSQVLRFQKEIGTQMNHYHIYDGSVIDSYAYGASTFCRPDNKKEMDLRVMIWGGDYVGACHNTN
jgi:hypothetical protein